MDFRGGSDCSASGGMSPRVLIVIHKMNRSAGYTRRATLFQCFVIQSYEFSRSRVLRSPPLTSFTPLARGMYAGP